MSERDSLIADVPPEVVKALAVYEATIQGLLNRVPKDWRYRAFLGEGGGGYISDARRIGQEAFEKWLAG